MFFFFSSFHYMSAEFSVIGLHVAGCSFALTSTNAWFSGCKWQGFQVSSKERADCSSFFVLPPGNDVHEQLVRLCVASVCACACHKILILLSYPPSAPYLSLFPSLSRTLDDHMCAHHATQHVFFAK